MRVSESMLYKRVTSSLATGKERMVQVTEPLLTGHRINRPSDDPIGTQRMARAERNMRRSEDLQGNVARSRVVFQITETTVTNVVDTLSEMSVLAVAMANDSMSAEDRSVAAAQAEAMLSELQGYGNTKFNGRYLFSGRMQDQPPFDANNQFVGDAVGRKIQVSEGLEVAADVPGPNVFGPAGATAFDAAEALVTALKSNDTAAIQAALGQINAAHGRATHALSDLGYSMVELQRAETFQQDKHDVLELQQAGLDEVDVAEAASQMSFAEAVYNTAIQAAGRINRMLDSLTRL